MSYLQNSGCSQLSIDDIRWKNFMRSTCAMACFRLSRVGYDTEVICVYGIGYGTDTTLFLLLLSANVVCDLYFDSHILVVLIITLILIIHIIHIISIKCVYVREYYEYSLTANK